MSAEARYRKVALGRSGASVERAALVGELHAATPSARVIPPRATAR